MADLAGKTLLITGASRGIGKSIALRAARDGANIIVAAKTTRPHPRLPGTIHDTAAEITAAGGRSLACVLDVRDAEQIAAVVRQGCEAFSGIDILVNNASAISLTGTLETTVKRYDLMLDINARGSFLCAQACLPHLRQAQNPHVLNIAPPLNFQAKWFGRHAAYTLSKYAMSVWVLGMSAEFAPEGIAFNALWPRTAIATAAVRNILGGEQMLRHCRRPEIMADAAHAILVQDSRACTGNFFCDEDVLAAATGGDFSGYAVEPGADLMPDFFID